MKSLQFNAASRVGFAFAAASLVASAAFAGGTHSGGHHEESPIGKPGVAAKVTRTIQVDMSNGNITQITYVDGSSRSMSYFRGLLKMTVVHSARVFTDVEAADFATHLRQRLLQP